jgi:hypothetical protein
LGTIVQTGERAVWWTQGTGCAARECTVGFSLLLLQDGAEGSLGGGDDGGGAAG